MKDTSVVKRFNLLNPETKMLQPGMIFDETNQLMLAFMFVQYSTTEDVVGKRQTRADPWTLTSFTPRNEPYYDTVNFVQGNLKETVEFAW